MFSYVLVGLLVLGMSGAAMADHGQLPGDEVKKVLSGASGEGKTDRGAGYEVRWGDDGAAKLDMDTGFSDTGKWMVEDGHFCAQWKKIRKGKKGCWNVRHLNGNKYLFKGFEGTNNITVTIKN